MMMGRYPHFGGRPGPHDEQIIDEVMAHFDVTEICNRNYQTLSCGEMQRVNFARMLAQLWGDGPRGMATRQRRNPKMFRLRRRLLGICFLMSRLLFSTSNIR